MSEQEFVEKLEEMNHFLSTLDNVTRDRLTNGVITGLAELVSQVNAGKSMLNSLVAIEKGIRATKMSINDILMSGCVTCPDENMVKVLIGTLYSPEFAEVKDRYLKCSIGDCFFCNMFIYNVESVVEFFMDDLNFSILDHYDSIYRSACGFDIPMCLEKLYNISKDLSKFTDVNEMTKRILSIKMQRRVYSDRIITWYNTH